MGRMRSGELFAGVGGLGMAVDAVFGSSPAWFAEVDAAPSRALAHHYPDVPNLGDVTKVDFRQVEHTHVRAGGFPCQDVSLAGRRRGMTSGTRSGLWAEFARSIEEDRPEWVVIENVRGLLSADADSDVEPCPLCVGDDPSHVLRALGAVLGDLADLGFDAEWTGLRAADIGAPHGRYRIFILAWPAERTTPHAGHGQRRSSRPVPAGGDDAPVGSDLGGSRGGDDHGVTLLPTPDAYSGNRGGSQDPEKRREGGHTVSLADVTEHALMPTPRASRGGSATETMYGLGATREDDERPQGQVVGDITDWGPYAAAIARWEAVTGRPAPAPVRYDGKGGKPRLNPVLTEWMMGWPAGWVTDPDVGLTRAEQLKACGNGVVPQQAVAALREMLTRPGVPAIREAVTA